MLALGDQDGVPVELAVMRSKLFRGYRSLAFLVKVHLAICHLSSDLLLGLAVSGNDPCTITLWSRAMEHLGGQELFV